MFEPSEEATEPRSKAHERAPLRAVHSLPREFVPDALRDGAESDPSIAHERSASRTTAERVTPIRSASLVKSTSSAGVKWTVVGR